MGSEGFVRALILRFAWTNAGDVIPHQTGRLTPFRFEFTSSVTLRHCYSTVLRIRIP